MPICMHVLIKFLNALQMELTVPFLMGCLERSIVNGKRECVVFDAAVRTSGYVSGYTRSLDYVRNMQARPMPWLHIFIPIPSRHSRSPNSGHSDV